jgi:outer membrane protein OmpA-like peptidoglycan-associated protein
MIAARIAVVLVFLLVPTLLAKAWIGAAGARLAEVQATGTVAERPAVASAADVAYCNPELKRILRRVLMSCGLVGGNAARGCQPLQAKNVATMSGTDFNALFRPMKDRGGIVQFEKGKATLDAEDLALVERVFADQKGASWFFVVSRASPEGSVETNRELSKARAEAVMGHLKQKFADPDLEKEVGMLWLGEEFAQLEAEFCEWQRSAGGTCQPEELNRSAFIAWIDCQL